MTNDFVSLFIIDCPSCAAEILTTAISCIGSVGVVPNPVGLIGCIQGIMNPNNPCFDCITEVVETSQIKNMDQIQL